MRACARAILIAVTLAFFGCDAPSQAPRRRKEKAIKKTSDPNYIIACMAAAGFEPLNEDEAPDICFSQHIYDTPSCRVQR